MKIILDYNHNNQSIKLRAFNTGFINMSLVNISAVGRGNAKGNI